MTAPLDVSPERFVQTLGELGTRRAAFVLDPDSGQLRASHAALQPLADAIAENRRDFDGHEAIFLEVGRETGALMGAYLHKTRRGQAAGGVRHWPYQRIGDMLSDGLRLARGMGRKNALAGLWWGGGKGVIARQPGELYRDPVYRRVLYREYGSFITSLRGCYVTAEDAGTVSSDMAAIFRTTRFVTCIPAEVGGSGNPSFATAKGVVCAIEGALDALGMGGLQGKRIAMQGVGNVGAAMIGDLLEAGVASIEACDIAEEQLTVARGKLEATPVSLRQVTPDDTSIFGADCDVLVPNALGGILNPTTIGLIRAKVVCGAANNQLLDDRRDDQALAERGITYVPDFLANRMGIVNCANEQYGSLPDDPAVTRHLGRKWENAVFVTTQRVLERARRESVTTTTAANALADELMQEPHPIWGHRSRLLVQSLVASRWHEAQ